MTAVYELHFGNEYPLDEQTWVKFRLFTIAMNKLCVIDGHPSIVMN